MGFISGLKRLFFPGKNQAAAVIPGEGMEAQDAQEVNSPPRVELDKSDVSGSVFSIPRDTIMGDDEEADNQ